MALKSYAQLAEEYQAAIDAIVLGGAQSYRIGTREVSQADLATLERLAEKYRNLAGRESNGNKIRSQRGVPHGR